VASHFYLLNRITFPPSYESKERKGSRLLMRSSLPLPLLHRRRGHRASMRPRRAVSRGWDEHTVSEKVGCLAVTKEMRFRLYILRRCVVMLLCWRKYGKS
ncbi:unnamed protein product, partial [Musa acuminata subsp. burmannicoides]